MKYIDEFRNHALAQKLFAQLRATVTRRWVVMEICGGQTHAIVRYGIDELLPPEIELAHGPGCPVCVTPVGVIDQAHALAKRPDIVFCSFGDMLRVPGSSGDLFGIRAQGGDVRVVYSPLECLKIAQESFPRNVVFFGIGFETTAPANAMAVWQARAQGIRNFSMLVSQVTVPPAMRAILEAPGNRVQAFLGAGHVCAVMGWEEYEPLAAQYQVPVVVTGFEPLDLLEGILKAVRQLEEGRHEVENAYSRAVARGGNPEARKMMGRVFEPCDRAWRGIGVIPGSGLRLREEFAEFDAERRFEVGGIVSREPEECISGLVLQGARRPNECPAFGTVCTPETPLGATMVSAEGACAAYYNYGRHLERRSVPRG